MQKRDRAKWTDFSVFLLKALMYVCVAAVFFIAMSFENPQILRVSRTAGVTLLTFCSLGAVLVSVYGGYNVGEQKPRPIIISISLAILINDCITYLQLQIMNVNDANNESLELFGLSFVYLLAAIVLQVLVIALFVYIGNRVYFYLNEPQKTLVVSSSGADERMICSKIDRYKLQFRVDEIIDFDDPNIEQSINRSDTVFFSQVPIAKRLELMEYCYSKQKNIYYHMDVPDVIEFCAHHTIIDDVPFMQVRGRQLSMDQRFIKRTMDIVFSLIAIILLSPFMAVVALAIKLCDGGSVFYRQDRATREGKVFKIIKFRTMYEHDHQTFENSAEQDDPRITPVGKILRKIRMDELPQLFNILSGDMSLVGPRPEMLENVESYTAQMPAFAYRLKVKAGLTGNAQIEGKYNTTPRDKMIMDLMYIEQYSVWSDIKLLLRTPTVFFKSDSTEAFEAASAPDEERESKSIMPGQ